MEIINILVLASIVEAVFETSKMLWQNGKLSIDKLGAMGIGLVIALGTGLDLFAVLDIPTKIPFLGMVLTGILISRGANFVHDILTSISNLKGNKLQS